MKKIASSHVLIAALIITGCSKQKDVTDHSPIESQKSEKVESGATSRGSSLTCTSTFLALSVEPSSGRSYLFRVDALPGSGRISYIPQNGPSGDNGIGSGLSTTTVTWMTGLSTDLTTGMCYGITGNAGSHPNSIIKFHFSNPNLILGITKIISLRPVDLSDIERNPLNSKYYAIDRSDPTNNKIVTVDVTTGIALPLSSGSTGMALRGLAIHNSGAIFLMRMNSSSGDLYMASPSSGRMNIGPCAYGPTIAPGLLSANGEMGLHFDRNCTLNFFTGNFTGSTTPTYILTNSNIPSCLISLPTNTVTFSSPMSSKPLVDFASI